MDSHYVIQRRAKKKWSLKLIQCSLMNRISFKKSFWIRVNLMNALRTSGNTINDRCISAKGKYIFHSSFSPFFLLHFVFLYKCGLTGATLTFSSLSNFSMRFLVYFSDLSFEEWFVEKHWGSSLRIESKFEFIMSNMEEIKNFNLNEIIKFYELSNSLKVHQIN